jgi:hypothetical protein
MKFYEVGITSPTGMNFYIYCKTYYKSIADLVFKELEKKFYYSQYLYDCSLKIIEIDDTKDLQSLGNHKTIKEHKFEW